MGITLRRVPRTLTMAIAGRDGDRTRGAMTIAEAERNTINQLEQQHGSWQPARLDFGLQSRDVLDATWQARSLASGLKTQALQLV